ncbi:hypothetical protein Y032_0211g2207 [Ancylostoma ceylanicum]|nr:hypothetical protein Y032_0211g2207 [Ancylostoma ceylanicum]
MRSTLMTRLLTLLLSNAPFLACLKCYLGTEGNMTEATVADPPTYMCSYEIEDPCAFSIPAAYQIYEVDGNSPKHCWVHDERVICVCTTDLCNGNIQLMKEEWKATKISDRQLHDCVMGYLRDTADPEHAETLVSSKIATEESATEAGVTSSRIASSSDSAQEIHAVTQPAGGPQAESTPDNSGKKESYLDL